MKLLRTNAIHKDFVSLIKLLDLDLKKKDGDEHAFYHSFNKIDTIKHVVLAYENECLLGCGALKKFNNTTMEVKRMYTSENHRGKGIATKILSELEKWGTELNYRRFILETGIKQTDAIHLYKKNGYHVIENYDQYKGMENSKCFEKFIPNKQTQQQQQQQQ